MLIPVLGLALAAAPWSAFAQTPQQPHTQHLEIWTGAEVYGKVWSLYGGGTYAPFGSVTEDGFRLRVIAGQGSYSYAAPRWTGTDVRTFDFHGAASFADVLAGYHRQLGSVTIKVLGGITLADHLTDDPEVLGGTEVGAKAVLETWWNVTDRVWTSLDLSWSTLEDVYGARTRLGWRALPALSLGIEGGALGDWEYQATRVGGFARYEWANGELSVSAGIADDSGRADVGLPGAYLTFGVVTRF